MDEPKSNLTAAPYMAFNFCCSVGIIFLNKIVMRDFGFEYATFLTGFHFVVTFICLKICSAFGMFTPVKIKISEVMPLALSFCGFVVFNNLSLQYNSVGLYQLAKVMTTPVVAILQLVLFGVPINNKLKVALVPVCVGVGMATVTDVAFNTRGAIYAVCGIMSTSLYQIWAKSRQQDLGVSSFQLLYYQAPLAALMVFSVCPLFDTIWSTPEELGILDYAWNAPALIAICTTGLLAFGVNLSIFLVIGKTSPISYNVLGHFKLCVILTGGFLFFHEDTNIKKVCGTLLAFIGIVAYTTIKLKLPNNWDQREKSTEESEYDAGSKEETSALVGSRSSDTEPTQRQSAKANGGTHKDVAS